MTCGTADAVASVRINLPTYNRAPARRADIASRYIRWMGKASRVLPDLKQISQLYSVIPLQPVWLAATQKRIQKSVLPIGHVAEEPGRWLSQQTADAAIDFFNTTAALLPAEPFVYSSLKGDLIAEFKSKQGTLTAVISPAFVLMYAVAGGEPIEKKVVATDQLREEVQKITAFLNGAVDTSK